MKILSKLFAVLFGLLGIAVAVCAIWVAFTFRSTTPMLLSPAKDAYKNVEAMLQEACSGDYAAASQRILGNPKFGMTYTPQDAAEEMVWEAFCSSFSYELVGECFTTDAGLSQKATITYLELDPITNNLQGEVQALLEERIAAAESMEELYDENNEFHESFVMDALCDVVRESVAKNYRTKTVEVTVNLIWREGQWMILPDAALLSALSGGIVK